MSECTATNRVILPKTNRKITLSGKHNCAIALREKQTQAQGGKTQSIQPTDVDGGDNDVTLEE